uniref:Sugar phosphate transporter domain-containing protein n=1 Tax=Alexandrium monilatum TaxID=311494 RepID=A0A7S4PY21_9DINO|mmetsp:Transcript_61240/g.192794  ORF Transcript_61240/g.192794 Transcript_61240/m.192794 type:complete len:566 (-) Transcript_61240:92-1789(-)
MAVAARILSELGFFLCLVLISEAFRRIAQKHSPDSSLVQALLICSLVLAWYTISITLVLFNKWAVTSWGDGGLKFPIFYAMTHMMCKGIFSYAFQRCIWCKPLPLPSRRDLIGTSLVGAMTGLDVAASMMSFLYISVTFFTMLKSASLIFLMVLGVAVGIEPCSLKVGCPVLVIAGGILLTSYGEARFDTRGFTLVLASELFAAIRWIVTQMILQGGSLGSMVVVFYMSPASTLTLFPLAMLSESRELAVLTDPATLARFLGMVMFPGFMAFLLLLVEVQLVKETSSLTLSVFGNLKSLVTIVFAIIVFGEQASPLQWLGLVIALNGMFGYSYAKQKAMSVNALASLRYEFLIQEEGEVELEDAKTGPAGIPPDGSTPMASPVAGVGFGEGRGAAAVQPASQAGQAASSCAPQVLGLPSSMRGSTSGQAQEPAAPTAEEPSARPVGVQPTGSTGNGKGLAWPRSPPTGDPVHGSGLDSPPQSDTASGSEDGGDRSPSPDISSSSAPVGSSPHEAPGTLEAADVHEAQGTAAAEAQQAPSALDAARAQEALGAAEAEDAAEQSGGL